MNLTHSGLKATDRTIALDKLNLVLAPHGVGKTSTRAALQFLLLGHVPELGKSKQATAALVRNGEMTVAMTLPDGRRLSRSLRRNGSSLAGSAEASWVRQGTPSDHEEAIAALAGREESEAVQNLDIRALLNLTPSSRAQAIESILSAARKTPGEIANAVADLAVMRLRGVDPADAPKKYNRKADAANLDDAVRAALLASAPMLEAKLKDSGIPGAATWAKDAKNESARALDGKTKAKEELEARLDDSPEAPEGEIARLESERDKLQREIGAAREREEESGRREQSRRIAKQELDFAATRLDSAEADVLAAEKSADEIPLLRERLAELDPDSLDEQARAKLDTLGELHFEPEPGAIVAMLEAKELEERYKAALASPWMAVLQIGKELKRYGDDSVSARGETLVTIANANRDSLDPETIKIEWDAASSRIAGEIKHKRACENRNEDVRRLRDRLKAEAATLHSKASEVRAKRTDLASAIQKAERALERANAALASAKASHEAAAKRVGELEGDGSPASDFTQVIQSRETALEDLKAKLDALHRAAAARAEFASILAEIGTAQAGREVYAALEWAVARVREQELGDSAGPLLDRIAKFLKAAGRTETPYLRPTRADCEIGWRGKDGDVAIQVMSGAEWALFSTAFSAAVIALRKPPLKVLIVEGGEVRADRLDSLLNGIASVADEIDLALVLYPHDAGTTPGNWNVVRLG